MYGLDLVVVPMYSSPVVPVVRVVLAVRDLDDRAMFASPGSYHATHQYHDGMAYSMKKTEARDDRDG